jgi:D-arabinose 1-dehydrogenase-like Zn-dependent alcohol dehydrogenase
VSDPHSAPRGIDDVEIALDAVQVHGAAGVGRVVWAGERADGLIDRRVLVGPIDPCGECDVCRRGGAAVCPLARRRDALGATVTAAARWLVPLDDGLELPVPAAAAVAGDVTLAYTLYARTGVGPREPVVVVGECPVGRFLIEILRAKGIVPAALATGGPWADWLRARGVPAAADRAALAAAFAAQDHGGRPWRVVCADPAAVAIAAALAGPRATLTVLAGAAALPPDLLAREVAVLGVAAPHPDLVVEVAAMCTKGEIDLLDGTSTVADPLRTHVRSTGPR